MTINFLPLACSYFHVHVNLDLSIPVCFYNGMDDYVKMWLQLAFPFYLILCLIMASRYFPTVQRLTSCRALSVLASLFLLSYTKILLTISSVIFSYSTIIHLPSKHTKLVWSVDGNIPLLGARFILLFTSCLVIFNINTFQYCLVIYQKTIKVQIY